MRLLSIMALALLLLSCTVAPTGQSTPLAASSCDSVVAVSGVIVLTTTLPDGTVVVKPAQTAASAVVVKVSEGKVFYITAKHVVSHGSVRIGSMAGPEMTVLARSDVYDLAVGVSERIEGVSPAELAVASPRVGTPVVLVGNALGAGVRMFRGIIATDKRFKGAYLWAGVPCEGGNSGGGLFEEETGRLVGMVVMRNKRFHHDTMCVPVEEIRRLLDTVVK